MKKAPKKEPVSLEHKIDSLTGEMQKLIEHFEQNPTDHSLRLHFLRLALKRREAKNKLHLLHLSAENANDFV